MNIKNWYVAVLAAALMIIGIAMVGFSASYSMTGFRLSFENIPGVGWMGVLFAALAFVAVSVATTLISRKHYMLGIIATIMALACGLIDVSGNYQALTASNQVEAQAYTDRLANYSTSVEALTSYRGEAELNQTFVKLMLSTDTTGIAQAQRHLIAEGLYEGRVDGVRGPLTNSAMLEYGKRMTERNAELKTLILSNEGVVKLGAPVELVDRSRYSIMFAVALTLLGAFCSLASSALFQIALNDSERDALAEAEELIAKMEAEALQSERVDNLLADEISEELALMRKEIGTSDIFESLRLVS